MEVLVVGEIGMMSRSGASVVNLVGAEKGRKRSGETEHVLIRYLHVEEMIA
jgi:hypothetical protein